MNPKDAYFDLLERTLTASLYDESAWSVATGFLPGRRGLMQRFRQAIFRWLRRRGLLLVRPRPFDPAARDEGRDWPCFGYTMVGQKRLRHLRTCIEAVLRDGVPGDLLEAGIWRGGAAIYMRAVLKSEEVRDRVVWAADSFAGLPEATAPQDRSAVAQDYSGFDYLAVPVDEVRANFARFGMLDDQVRFLPGWFADTLPGAPIEKLAVLSVDGDMYKSTRDVLDALGRRVSPGGFVIVDDYGDWPGCRAAVDEYRTEHGIRAPLVPVTSRAVCWRVE